MRKCICSILKLSDKAGKKYEQVEGVECWWHLFAPGGDSSSSDYAPVAVVEEIATGQVYEVAVEKVKFT